MVYCNLKEKKDNSAIYFFGATTEDVNGEVIFYTEPIQPQIIKQPSKQSVSIISLNKIVAKYKNQFIEGIFPNKISYER